MYDVLHEAVFIVPKENREEFNSSMKALEKAGVMVELRHTRNLAYKNWPEEEKE